MRINATVQTKIAMSMQRQVMLATLMFLIQDLMLNDNKTTDVMKNANIGNKITGKIDIKTKSATATAIPCSGVVAEFAMSVITLLKQHVTTNIAITSTKNTMPAINTPFFVNFLFCKSDDTLTSSLILFSVPFISSIAPSFYASQPPSTEIT